MRRSRPILVSLVVLITGYAAPLGLDEVFGIPIYPPLFLIYPKYLMVRLAERRVARECPVTGAADNCGIRLRSLADLVSNQMSFDDAVSWYERAAAGGDIPAMFNLGYYYATKAYREMAVKPGAANPGQADAAAQASHGDAARSVSWYRRAANQGFAPALNNLADVYRSGIAGPAAPSEAFALFLAAATVGNPVASWNVALAYASGYGVARDSAESLKWSAWNATGTSGNGVMWPILERTTLSGRPMPTSEVNRVRETWKEHSIAVLTITPPRPDTRVPSFHRMPK